MPVISPTVKVVKAGLSTRTGKEMLPGMIRAWMALVEQPTKLLKDFFEMKDLKEVIATWTEGLENTNAMIVCWLIPLVSAFKNVEKRYRGEVDPNEFGSCGHYDGLVAMLAGSVLACVEIWELSVDMIGNEGLKKKLSSIKPAYLISRRPLQEILLDSMVSKAFLEGCKNTSDHLASVKDGWVVFAGPVAFKDKPQGLRCIGLSMTLCALWTGNLAIIGSSLVDWSSSLKTFPITEGKHCISGTNGPDRADLLQENDCRLISL